MISEKKDIYIYSSIMGIFVLSEELQKLRKIEIDEPEEGQIAAGIWIKKEEHLIDELSSQASNGKIIFCGYKKEKKMLAEKFCGKLVFSAAPEVLAYFKSMVYFELYRQKNISETRKSVKNSVSNDNLIIQAANSIDEASLITNTLGKRLSEWYSLHNPEYARTAADSAELARAVKEKTKEYLLGEIGISEKKSMGAELGIKISEKDIDAMKNLADEIIRIAEYKKAQTTYLDDAMQENCPNLRALTGTLLGAKLLSLAGSLKNLSEMPASTIQLLGAEKALFRHIKTGAKCPKYGIIHEHPLILKTKKENHGKAARALADKINIAVKIDYFKGEYAGDRLVKELEKKFSK